MSDKPTFVRNLPPGPGSPERKGLSDTAEKIEQLKTKPKLVTSLPCPKEDPK